jgi:hypothetical protein
MPNLHAIAYVLVGEVSGDQLLAPGPYHSPRDRSLSVKISATARAGFVCHSSFAGDDFRTCPDHVKSQLGVARFEPTRGAARRAPAPKVVDDDRDKAGGRQCSPGLHAQSPDRGDSSLAFFGQGHPHPVRRRAACSATGVAQALRRPHPGAVA